MKRLLLLLLVLFGVLQTQSQNNADALQNPEIKVIARAQKERILLRWAPTTPIAWKQLNVHGYTIERYTTSRNGTTLSNPEKETITKTALTPEPINSWVTIVNNNDNAAIVAQALYGESFSVSNKNDIETIIAQSEEIQQRYTFTLFVADQDFEIAKKAGLGFTDTTVKPNEKYVYRILSNVPETIKKITYGNVLIGLSDFEPLPKPLDLTSSFKDNSVALSWNFKLLSTTYNSYNIERAASSSNFKRINETPYTTLNKTKQNERTGRIFYLDSITNNKNYSYRVQGITAFGELGPYSEETSGEGKAVLKYAPHLTVKNILDENNVKLTWEFPEEGNKDIKGFELNRSNGNGETKEIIVKDIPASKRTVNYNKLAASNYFTITAVGKNGSKRNSFPMLVQPIDSIPPSKPQGLEGTIDSLGVVTLKWIKNAEQDLNGYRIYRGNLEKEEFSQLTVSPIKRNTFIDTVTIKSLNSKVYYKIIATDFRYNMSDASEVLILKKPDVIPPTSPVFKRYELKEETIYLTWAKSSSKDVTKHILYRKTNNEKEWQLVLEGDLNQEAFSDQDIEQGYLYSYTILAIDESELESLPSPSISIMVPKTKTNTTIKGFYAQVDQTNKAILLSWRYKEPDIAEFEIYKAKKGEKLRLLRNVPADSKRLYDYNITINTQYQYAIRAVFKDGRLSKLEQKIINY